MQAAIRCDSLALACTHAEACLHRPDSWLHPHVHAATLSHACILHVSRTHARVLSHVCVIHETRSHNVVRTPRHTRCTSSQQTRVRTRASTPSACLELPDLDPEPFPAPPLHHGLVQLQIWQLPPALSPHHELVQLLPCCPPCAQSPTG